MYTVRPMSGPTEGYCEMEKKENQLKRALHPTGPVSRIENKLKIHQLIFED